MAEETQVLVKFTTRLPPELHVPPTEVAVPASLKRYGLSQIINHLLALDPVQPFDFIIDGELVRKSLQQHLLDHSISPEVVVEVQYVPAVVPPEPKSAIPQDDWVTAVAAVASGSTLASGAADGIVRLWTGAGDCMLEFSAHKLGVNSLAAVFSAADQQQQQQGNTHSRKHHQHKHQQQQHSSLLLSAGKDNTVKLWQVAPAPSAHPQQNGSSSSSAACIAVCQGHKEAVQAVAASPAGRLCCSGGWDGQLLLWRTGEQLLEEAASAGVAEAEDPAEAGNRKKRKTAAAANGTAAAPLQLSATADLPGHVHCVSAVTWPEEATLYSGGWDHSVRRYDVETQTNTDTYNGSKAVFAVAAAGGAGGGSGVDGGDNSSSSSGSGIGSNVVAFGGSDKVLRIWDTRATGSGEALAVKSYAAHEGWISSIAWRPGSSFHIATGGHDGAVKVWDVRTHVPLGSLQQHADAAKVLCVGWWGGQVLVSGGSDCKLQLYDLP